MNSLLIRDTHDGFELVLTDENGQVGKPHKITNEGLIDLDINIGKFKQLAWHRIRQNKTKPDKDNNV